VRKNVQKSCFSPFSETPWPEDEKEALDEGDEEEEEVVFQVFYIFTLFCIKGEK